MSLIISHNTSALNTHRNLSLSGSSMSKAIEKLSSGYKINVGADDPSGLIISEQLRSQISGLERAVRNSSEAYNLIGIAEGALNEMNTIMKKMRALAIHAANSGVTSPEQVAADQSEMDSGIETLNRIANTTRYSDQYLLNGSKELVYDITTVVNEPTDHALLDTKLTRVDQIFKRDGVKMSIGYTGEKNRYQANTKTSAQRAYLEADAAYSLSEIKGATVTNKQEFILTGTSGSRLFSFAGGTHVGTIVEAINNVRDSTGIGATLTFASDVRVDQTVNGTRNGSAPDYGPPPVSAEPITGYSDGTYVYQSGDVQIYGAGLNDPETAKIDEVCITPDAAAAFKVGYNCDGDGKIYAKVVDKSTNSIEYYKDRECTMLIGKGDDKFFAAANNSGIPSSPTQNLDGLFIKLNEHNVDNQDVFEIGVVGQRLDNLKDMNVSGLPGWVDVDNSVMSGVNLGYNTSPTGDIYYRYSPVEYESDGKTVKTFKVEAFSHASMEPKYRVAASGTIHNTMNAYSPGGEYIYDDNGNMVFEKDGITPKKTQPQLPGQTVRLESVTMANGLASGLTITLNLPKAGAVAGEVGSTRDEILRSDEYKALQEELDVRGGGKKNTVHAQEVTDEVRASTEYTELTGSTQYATTTAQMVNDIVGQLNNLVGSGLYQTWDEIETAFGKDAFFKTNSTQYKALSAAGYPDQASQLVDDAIAAFKDRAWNDAGFTGSASATDILTSLTGAGGDYDTLAASDQEARASVLTQELKDALETFAGAGTYADWAAVKAAFNWTSFKEGSTTYKNMAAATSASAVDAFINDAFTALSDGETVAGGLKTSAQAVTDMNAANSGVGTTSLNTLKNAKQKTNADKLVTQLASSINSILSSSLVPKNWNELANRLGTFKNNSDAYKTLVAAGYGSLADGIYNDALAYLQGSMYNPGSFTGANITNGRIRNDLAADSESWDFLQTAGNINIQPQVDTLIENGLSAFENYWLEETPSGSWRDAVNNAFTSSKLYAQANTDPAGTPPTQEQMRALAGQLIDRLDQRENEYAASVDISKQMEMMLDKASGKTARSQMPEGEQVGSISFINLGMRVYSMDYGSAETIRIQNKAGNLFYQYREADSMEKVMVKSGTTVQVSGQDAEISLNGAPVFTTGLIANTTTPDFSGSLVFNQGKLGLTTLAVAGYDEGKLFSRATALQGVEENEPEITELRRHFEPPAVTVPIGRAKNDSAVPPVTAAGLLNENGQPINLYIDFSNLDPTVQVKIQNLSDPSAIKISYDGSNLLIDATALGGPDLATDDLKITVPVNASMLAEGFHVENPALKGLFLRTNELMDKNKSGGYYDVVDSPQIQANVGNVMLEVTTYATNPRANTNEDLTNFLGGMQFQLGNTEGDQDRTIYSIQSMSMSNLGRITYNGQEYCLQNVLGGGSASLSKDPILAMHILAKAVDDVSSLRARLGAFQSNMLQTNINNLEVSIENITKTESAIRDTDMAEESTQFTRFQIMQQAGTSMLAQANQVSQNVLSLLQ